MLAPATVTLSLRCDVDEVAVEAVGLRKAYDGFEAVKGIDFEIRRGECCGFLGPNGAGKTSTMRLLQALSHRYESFNFYLTLVVAPMFLFGGVFFPLERMPDWVGRVAQVLPLTHAVAIARALVRGTTDSGVLIHRLAMGVFTAVAWTASWALMVRRLRV